MDMQQERLNHFEPSSGRGLDILLVDDDDICLFIHRRVLDLSGHCASTRTASNGERALEILHRATTGEEPGPDLILLDLEMPVMNGIAFLEAVQRLKYAQHQRVAIVLLTSSVSEGDKQYAMSLGVSHYISKPFTLEAFNAVVHALYKASSAPATVKQYLIN